MLAACHALGGCARRRAEHLAQLGEVAGDAVFAGGELVDLALEAGPVWLDLVAGGG